MKAVAHKTPWTTTRRFGRGDALGHHLAVLPGARSILKFHRSPRKLYSCRVMPPACGTGARIMDRRRYARCREKPNCHKCACRSAVQECPVNSPNILPDNDLRAAALSLAHVGNRQEAGAEIPFLRTKIPFSHRLDRHRPAPHRTRQRQRDTNPPDRHSSLHRPRLVPLRKARPTVPLWPPLGKVLCCLLVS